jgi:nucleoside-diphosphate-sugar epimerase
MSWTGCAAAARPEIEGAVARALIVGCGCRGRALGSRLLDEGWAVRGTSRREQGLAAIEAAGIEPALADPARPGTVLDLVGDVALVVWLLGSARGAPGAIAAIHGEKLERMLERLVETPVRRFAYEAAGSAGPAVLERGAAVVREAGERWRIPISLLAGEEDMSKLGWELR